MSLFRVVALAAMTAAVACDDDDDDLRVTVDPTAPTQDIVDTAASRGLDTFGAAVRAADLEATLRGPGPFTVFAPTNEAFTRLPAGTLDTLLLPTGRDQLRSVLTYHVVAGNLASTSLATMTQVTTVNGQPLQIQRTATGGLMVGTANVVVADVRATNGVIHIIDAVLLPP